MILERAGVDVEAVDGQADLAHVPADERLRLSLFTDWAGNAHERLQQLAIRRLEPIDRVEDARLSARSASPSTIPARVTTRRLTSDDMPSRLLASTTLYSPSSGTLIDDGEGAGLRHVHLRRPTRRRARGRR